MVDVGQRKSVTSSDTVSTLMSNLFLEMAINNWAFLCIALFGCLGNGSLIHPR